VKTTPEEATRRAAVTRLESVKAVFRQRTEKSSGRKDMTLAVSFTVECEGRRAKGRIVDTCQEFVFDRHGNKVLIPGTKKNWFNWAPPKKPVEDAVLSAVYGTTNVRNDPKSNTARSISWESGRIIASLAHRVAMHIRSKKMTETLLRAERSERRKNMLDDMTSAIEEVLRKYPEMQKKNLDLAFEEAKKAQVVREVMET
jgi:hypothetical protein